MLHVDESGVLAGRRRASGCQRWRVRHLSLSQMVMGTRCILGALSRSASPPGSPMSGANGEESVHEKMSHNGHRAGGGGATRSAPPMMGGMPMGLRNPPEPRESEGVR